MSRGILPLASLISLVLFPWPFTALLALAAAAFEPLVPFAIGLLADALYYAPQSGGWPLYALLGAAATLAAFFVRSQLEASIISR